MIPPAPDHHPDEEEFTPQPLDTDFSYAYGQIAECEGDLMPISPDGDPRVPWTYLLRFALERVAEQWLNPFSQPVLEVVAGVAVVVLSFQAAAAALGVTL